MEDFLQRCPVTADAPKGFDFGPSHFLNINDLSLSIIRNTPIMMITMHSTLNTIEDFDRLRQLKLVYRLEKEVTC